MRRIAFAAVVAAVIGGVGWLAFQRLTAIPPPGTLYGNVEIRQVDLSFNAEGTVLTMPKHKGDRVEARRVDRSTRSSDLPERLRFWRRERDNSVLNYLYTSMPEPKMQTVRGVLTEGGPSTKVPIS
jgi:HlyD family secretion protein